jgi:putative transcriptional regulator
LIVSNHPNRSKKSPSAARNPRPEEVRAAREAAGLTQTEAAELIYCEMRTWQDWEGGQRRMHPAFWELWRSKVSARPPKD